MPTGTSCIRVCTKHNTHSFLSYRSLFINSAQLYATCTDLSAQLASKLSPQRTVTKSKTIRHTVRVRSTLKTAALPSDLGFTVQLPAGVTFVKSKTNPPIYMGVMSGKNKRAVMEPVINATANTVTWTEVPMPAKARRAFKIWARVLPTATGSLAFDSWLWQDAVAGNPYCFNHAPPQSVRVRVLCVHLSSSATSR